MIGWAAGIRTEQAHQDWARRFILFHGKRHPQEMGALEVEAFLSHLATERQVSASTQNQAKAAILYLYRQVLAIELPWLDEVAQAKRPRRLPVVLLPRAPGRHFCNGFEIGQMGSAHVAASEAVVERMDAAGTNDVGFLTELVQAAALDPAPRLRPLALQLARARSPSSSGQSRM